MWQCKRELATLFMLACSSIDFPDNILNMPPGDFPSMGVKTSAKCNVFHTGPCINYYYHLFLHHSWITKGSNNWLHSLGVWMYQWGRPEKCENGCNLTNCQRHFLPQWPPQDEICLNCDPIAASNLSVFIHPSPSLKLVCSYTNVDENTFWWSNTHVQPELRRLFGEPRAASTARIKRASVNSTEQYTTDDVAVRIWGVLGQQMRTQGYIIACSYSLLFPPPATTLHLQKSPWRLAVL